MDNHDYSNTPVDNSQVPRQDSFAGKNPQYITQPPNRQGSGRTPSRRITRVPAVCNRLIIRIIGGISQYGYYHYPYVTRSRRYL